MSKMVLEPDQPVRHSKSANNNETRPVSRTAVEKKKETRQSVLGRVLRPACVVSGGATGSRVAKDIARSFGSERVRHQEHDYQEQRKENPHRDHSGVRQTAETREGSDRTEIKGTRRHFGKLEVRTGS